MSMNNKQRWMGGVVLLGGGVLLAALLLKGKEELHQNNIKHPELVEQVQQQNVKDSGMVQLQGLTVDVETEKRLLEEQRRAREKAVAEQEARAAEFLAQQQQAEADAARKAAEEYAALNAARTGAQQSSDNIPPELIEDEKAKQKRLAEEKLAAQKKLDQQKASQSSEADKKRNEERLKAEAQRKADEERKALAKAAEDKKLREAEAQRKLEAQRKADQERQVAAKAAEEKKLREAEAKRKEDAKKKAEAEKARDLLENGDKQWMVQVALAANAANADSVISKLKAKGYKVVQSPTSKGIRIMVGPAKSRDVADVTRKKITTDASLNMKSAWVIDWVPLDRR